VFTKPARGWGGTYAREREARRPGWCARRIRRLGGHVGSDDLGGAPSVDVGANHSQGLVFGFNEPAGGWSGILHPSATLVASDGVAYENFGQTRALAASGDYVFVGEDGQTPHGVVYVFRRPSDGWHGMLSQTASRRDAHGAFHHCGGSRTNGGIDSSWCGYTSLDLWEEPLSRILGPAGYVYATLPAGSPDRRPRITHKPRRSEPKAASKRPSLRLCHREPLIGPLGRIPRSHRSPLTRTR
jgi:hypothetical protein